MSDIVKMPKFMAAPGRMGCFGLLRNGVWEWENCRERFQTKSDPAEMTSFFFNHNAGRGTDVIEFMRTVEQAVRLPAEDALIFNMTDHNDKLQVVMSTWWKYRLRRSLMSALLRCGLAYTSNDGERFVAALKSQPYTVHTWKAVERFLCGYTASKLKKTTPFGGWQQFFDSQNDVLIQKTLVKKKRRKETTAELTGELTGDQIAAPEPVSDAPQSQAQLAKDAAQLASLTGPFNPMVPGN